MWVVGGGLWVMGIVGLEVWFGVLGGLLCMIPDGIAVVAVLGIPGFVTSCIHK